MAGWIFDWIWMGWIVGGFGQSVSPENSENFPPNVILLLNKQTSPSFEQGNTTFSQSLHLFLTFFVPLPQTEKKNNGMPRRRGFLLVQDFPKKESVWNLPPANYLLPWSSWTRATSITGVTKTLFKENQMPGWWVFPIHFSQKSITFHHFPILGAKNHQKIWMKLPPAIPDPQKSWTRTNPRGISPCHH